MTFTPWYVCVTGFFGVGGRAAAASKSAIMARDYNDIDEKAMTIKTTI